MKRFEHSLSMKGNSWHARWYRHWVSLGGKQPEYKENLCHYVRVLLFWAPQRWFWRGKIKGEVSPWAVTAFLMLVGLIITAVIIWPLESLGVFGGVAALIVILVALTPVAEWIENNQDKANRIALKASSPLWIVPYLVFRFAKWAWNKALKKTIKWFFTHSYFVKGMAPVTVCVISGFTVFGIQATPVFLKVLLYGGAWLGMLVVCFGVIIGLVVLDDNGKLDSIKSGVPKLFKSIIEGTTDTVKLGYTYLATKKRGSAICPFINFEKPETGTPTP